MIRPPRAWIAILDTALAPSAILTPDAIPCPPSSIMSPLSTPLHTQCSSADASRFLSTRIPIRGTNKVNLGVFTSKHREKVFENRKGRPSYIVCDYSRHGGTAWKLYDHKDSRRASLSSDGSIRWKHDPRGGMSPYRGKDEDS